MEDALIPTGEIASVRFTIASDPENLTDGFVSVIHPSIKNGNIPYEFGIYDARMGTTQQNYNCQTCLHKKNLCPGHAGYITLNYPVQNPLFLKRIVRWLKIICLSCGALMIETDFSHISKRVRFGHYVKNIKLTGKNKPVFCPKCGERHYNIIRDKYDHLFIFQQMESAADKTYNERLMNKEILDIFNMVSPETVRRVGLSMESHPSKLIVTVVNVPANSIRPDIAKHGSKGSSNDITMLLKALVIANNTILEGTANYSDTKYVAKLDKLDLTYYTMISGASSSAKRTAITSVNNVPITSLSDRLRHKHGRIRGNILGKRVGNACRTVISADPTIHPYYLGIPISIARQIQMPVRVHKWNYDELMIYFNNGMKSYPGCTKITKAGSNNVYAVSHLKPDFRLELGDIIWRDIIDGDVIAFNRAPSLTPANITCHHIKVMHSGNTMSFNVIDCNLYNADFDGDEMGGHFPLKTLTKVEIAAQMSIGERFNSFQYGTPVIGSFQDALIGGALMTKHGIKIKKMDAMRMFATLGVHSFTKDEFTPHELISMIIPKINFSGKPSYYDTNLAGVIRYAKEDISVHIENGVLKSGILDKKTIGQGSSGGIIHVIKNQYGSKSAVDFTFHLQQMVSRYIKQRGFTIGIDDILVTKDTLQKIHEKTSAIIGDSIRITDRFNAGELIPPINMTVTQYYEEMQLAALKIDDEFIKYIINDIDTDTNGLFQLIIHKSRGDLNNLVSISSNVGQQELDGERIPVNFGFNRTFKYYTSFDADPESRGFIPDSYTSGLSPTSFIMASMNGRVALIKNALSTSVTGTQNRTSVKNLESMLVNNLREGTKGTKIVQNIFGEDGMDPRFIETVKIPTTGLNNKEFEAYHINVKSLPAKYSAMQKYLDDEFKQLSEDRNLFRSLMIAMEDQSGINNRLYSDSIKSPLNMHRIINDVIIGHEKYFGKKTPEISPKFLVERVAELCNDIVYAAFNDIQRSSKLALPEYWTVSMTFTKILIRSYLNMKTLMNKVNEEMLNQIIDVIYYTYSNAYIDYGTAVGIIAAQSLSEPMTQFVLDSKHRSGRSSVGSRTQTLVRIEEILGARPTETMKNPSMTIETKEPENKIAVQQIANHIEMMNVGRFIIGDDMQLLFEKYGEPVYPEFAHERKIIERFEKNNPSYRPPGDITSWCIRFALDRTEMIVKNMSLEEIILALQANFPQTYIVYNNENENDLMVRIYLSGDMRRSKAGRLVDNLKDIMDDISATIIRGIAGIQSAEVLEEPIPRTYIDDNGNITTKKIYMIQTIGTNLPLVIANQSVDPHHVQTDSIIEVSLIYGIEAARAKIMNELKSINSASITSGVCHCHFTVYADEMTRTGRVTSIKRTGLTKREQNNTLLLMSTSHVVQVAENAAFNSSVDHLEGVSSKIMIGSVPEAGTSYNSVVVNTAFVKSHTANVNTILDDL